MYTIFSLLSALLFVVPTTAFAQLQAGVARADITPPVGGPMYGYAVRGSNVSLGVHDPLFAKALVVDDGSTKLAIVSLDMGAMTRMSTDNVRKIVLEQTGIEHVILAVTHSHSTPQAVSDFPSSESPWIRDTERKIADVIIEADHNLQQARIGMGRGEVREGHNRRLVRADGEVMMLWTNRDRLPTAPLDYELGVIQITGHDEPIATLINFTCHPVVLGPENLLISADYPGALMRMIEAEIGGQAMFLQGAPGDINPFWDKTPPNEGGFEEVEKMGRAIADEVVRVLYHIVEYETAPRLSVHSEEIWLASREDVLRTERNIPAEINTVLIGDKLALGAFPGEFFVEHGLSFKCRSPFEYTFFVGYSNDALGYFPTIQSTTEGGYGASSATRVEVGAGEQLVSRALINLLYQGGNITP